MCEPERREPTARVSRRNAEGIHALDGMLSRIGFPDYEFDVVIASQVN
jgi:hypothetical protein